MSDKTQPALKMKDTNKLDKIDQKSSQAEKEFKENNVNAMENVEPRSIDKENLKRACVGADVDDNPLDVDEVNSLTKDLVKDPVKRKKISGYIVDKALRTRSYVRRRPIPLKRVVEIDIQCGTKSFLVQINKDFEEVIYCGNNDISRHFLCHSGLKISDVNNILVAGKYQARPKGTSHHWEHDYNPAPDTDDDDEDFYDTIKNKKEKERETKSTNKKSGEIEYIKSPVERFKKFKAFKDGIFSKVKEIDSVCGLSSFVLILNLERDMGFYYGDKHLVSEFFTTGIKYPTLLRTYNVRKFEVDEVESNMCCVPQCAVTRNTLSRWRMAAIQNFKFPPELPMNLHLCPEEDRNKWIAEIDLDPTFKSKVVVCSLHFVDGFPTPENPYPTQFLSDSSWPEYFMGKIPVTNPDRQSPSDIVHQFCQSLLESSVMRNVNRQIDLIETRLAAEQKRKKDREEKRRRELAALKNIKFYKFTPLSKLNRRSLKRKTRSWRPIRKIFVGSGSVSKQLLRSILQRAHTAPATTRRYKCRFCSSKFVYTKALFLHIRNEHVAPVRKREERRLDISNGERRRVLSRLYPPPNSRILDPKKKYVCAVCKSVCDLFGLFVHMKEVHHGMLCQYCLKLFKKVRDLEHHLITVHKQQPRYYSSMEMFKQYTGTNYSLACGECNTLLSPDQAEMHECGKITSFDCPWCIQQFATNDELVGHIVNGWCPNLKLFDGLPAMRDIQVVYKILTGKMLEMPEQEDDVNPTEMMDTGINALLEVDIGDNWSMPSKMKETVTVKKPLFSCFDKFAMFRNKEIKIIETVKPLLEDLPLMGNIFSGSKSKGISNNIKKEFKDKGRDFSITEQIGPRDSGMIDESVKDLIIQKAGRNFIIEVPKKLKPEEELPNVEPELSKPIQSAPSRVSKRMARQPADKIIVTSAPTTVKANQVVATMPKKEKPKIETRHERITRLDAEIKENLKRMRQVVDLFTSCLFCQQCKTVSVDAQFLLSHFHIIHSDDGVNNSLGENAQHCITRIKRYLREARRKEILFNYCPPEEIFVLEFYRCSYCSTTECRHYEQLFKHTAFAHNTKVLTCNICHNIFLNYGSLISHVCSGPPTTSTARARFACKVCHRIDLSSFLDFQTHIRREHNTCEICFETEQNQVALHRHCSSHDQDLMCMKCFVTFEKVESFRKHMFWKHGSEQTDCPTCHCPTWPHVYHFCLPNLAVPCHNCDLTLPNAAAFRVHSRLHQGTSPHVCTQPKCSKSFISKSLLWKHQVRRHPELKQSVEHLLYRRKLKKEAAIFGARSIDSLDVIYNIVDDIWNRLCDEIDKRKPQPEPTPVEREKSPEKKESVLDAAIRSIMPESDDDSKPNDASVESSALPNLERDAIQATIAGRSYSEDNSWQAGIDALLAGASVKLPKVPIPSDLPPDQLFQNYDNEEIGDRSSDDVDDDPAPVIGGLWNQDLMFIGKSVPQTKSKLSASPMRGVKVRGSLPSTPKSHTFNGPRLRGMGARYARPVSRIKDHVEVAPTGNVQSRLKTNESIGGKSQWDLNLSESSEDEPGGQQYKRPPAVRPKLANASRPLLDHDYCYAAFMLSQEPLTDTNEMDKIVSNVAFDGFGDGYEQTYVPIENIERKKRKKRKKDKKKRKKKKKEEAVSSSNSSDSSDLDVGSVGKVDMFGIQARNNSQSQLASTPAAPTVAKKTVRIKSPGAANMVHKTPTLKRGPKPKYHTPDVAKTGGVTAGVARPSFDTDSSSHGDTDGENSNVDEEQNNEDIISDNEVRSSDLDTDFSADETPAPPRDQKPRPPVKTSKPTLKLKIKLPPQQKDNRTSRSKSKKRRRSVIDSSHDEKDAKPLSKKMRESLALNQRPASSEEEQYEDESYDDAEDENNQQINVTDNQEPIDKLGENEKLYCYCQCPHDDISEMIGCDAPDCRLEWFHFECVGIMVPPEGKWYCPECTKRYGLE